MYEGDSIYNEIALITPPTHGLELYTIYGVKDQGFTFEWCIKLYSIILTYLVTHFEKGKLIYTVYIFIRIEKKYFNKVRKVRCTFLKKRLTNINGTYIVFKFNFLLIAKIYINF